VVKSNDGENASFAYVYDVQQSNKNKRTIQNLNWEASDEMLNVCYNYGDCQYFLDYYQDENYADKWITAALDAKMTNFIGGRGDVNFTTHMNAEARGQAASSAMVYLSVWMAVVKRLYRAVQYCMTPCHESSVGKCRDDAIHALDIAMAYYAGSLEGPDGSLDGVLLYALADRLAIAFRTAGEYGSETEGTSFVNLQIIELATDMQQTLLDTSESAQNCYEVESKMYEIVGLMTVPLVQGVLLSAWNSTVATDSTTEIEQAKGSAFAAAVLPFVYTCSKSHALVVSNRFGFHSDANTVEFVGVKSVLEQSYYGYFCLYVNCEQVGGIWNGESYETDAEPCQNVYESGASSPVVTLHFWLVSLLGVYIFLVM